MISNLESIFTGPSGPDIVATIRRNDRRFALDLLDWFTRQPPSDAPFDWLCAHARIHTPTVRGPFDPVGREYMRDPINDINDESVRTQTCCWGTGGGKTMKNIGQALWAFQHDPFSGLYVMPSKEGEGGARQFNNGSMIKSIEATPCFADQIPRGADRHKFSGLHLDLGANNLGFVGANSSAQIAAKRCRIIWLDEQDKYKEKLGREAGADYLAGERLKSVANSKLLRQSTPTLEDAGIWPHLMASDLRRRLLPCPHCNAAVAGRSAPLAGPGWFLLVWSEEYTVLPTKMPDGTLLPLAKMVWDRQAKRPDGEWDIDRVVRSARFECPHCHQHLRDEHRIWMDRHGLWLPTRQSLDHRGYHLPSWYAPIPLDKNGQPDFKATYGGMAKKFLEAKSSGQGMAGWINSDAAEVNAHQDTASKIELNTTPVSQPDWVSVLTADFHKTAPYIWFVVRKWCAFKLLPPFPIENGLPTIQGIPLPQILEQPGNEQARANCEILLGAAPASTAANAAWHVIGELMRFDSGTGRSPLVDFLIAQRITGPKLVQFYRELAGANTHDFRKLIHQEMARVAGAPDGGRSARPPRGGDSELVACGNLETSGQRLWEDLRDLETEFKVGQGLPIDRRCTFIDCGYQEEFDAEVLQQCYERADHFKWYDPTSPKHAPLFHGFWPKGQAASPSRHAYCQPCPVDGWLPLRGIPTNRPQGDGKISRDISLRVADPFNGTADAGRRVIEVLNVPQGLFWFRKQDLLQRRTKNTWGISPQVSLFPKNYGADGTRLEESRFRLEDYQRQMNVQFYNETTKKVEPRGGRGGSQNRRNPYHLDDCETYQVAAAEYLEFFEVNTTSGRH